MNFLIILFLTKITRILKLYS